MIALLSVLLACSQTDNADDHGAHCNQDPEASLVADDADCDGVLTVDDCDDTDPETVNDMDCDGVLTVDDCDDTDPETVNDMDCDGVLAVDDCDDTDPETVNDMDCDGVSTADDCDDGDAESTSVADDADCDGVVAAMDCDDSSPWLLWNRVDTDCDGYEDAHVIASGYNHTCAVLANGSVDCWGSGSFGLSDIPDATFSSISVGYVHTCGLTTEGSVECWGVSAATDDGSDFNYGQVDDAPEGSFVAVTSGDFHSCAVRTDGTAVCWGRDDDGQSSTPEFRPPDEFHQMAAGSYHTCAILYARDRGVGQVECWGSDADGQAAGPDTRIPMGQVVSGVEHSCAFGSDGVVYCWGAGAAARPPSPDELRVTALSAKGKFTCGIANAADYDTFESGQVECWGYNGDGQLDVLPGRYLQVSAGNGYVTAVAYDGTVHCWGTDFVGNCVPPEGLSLF